MKTAIAIIGLCVAFTGYGLAQTNQPQKQIVKAAKDPLTVVLPDPLTTKSGTTYSDIKLQ
jgi:hypothetical protein